MRAAERCTGVTNAVFGTADGAPVRAKRAPPLLGAEKRGGEWVRITQAMEWGYQIVRHKEVMG